MGDDGGAELPRWGNAGQRLTEAEGRTRRAALRAQALQRLERRAQNEAMAKRRWAAGLVVPYNITTALDMLGLEGPEVDLECGAEEPAVDLWEQGRLYPTWDQLFLLSRLTQRTAYFFTVARTSISIYDTSMRFHVNLKGYTPPEPIMRFPDDVIRRCPGTNVDDPMRAGLPPED